MVEAECSENRFAASVRIGKGLRPITQGGGLVVEGGQVRLLDGKDRVIAEGPVGDVWVHEGWVLSSGLRVHIDGTKYTLDSAGAFTPVGGMAGTRSLTKAFLEWFPAHGGNVGKPPS